MFSLNSVTKIFVIKRAQTCRFLHGRRGCCHGTDKTHVRDRIFKLSPIHASVIYQIPWNQWIQWIQWKFCSIKEKLHYYYFTASYRILSIKRSKLLNSVTLFIKGQTVQGDGKWRCRCAIQWSTPCVWSSNRNTTPCVKFYNENDDGVT